MRWERKTSADKTGRWKGANYTVDKQRQATRLHTVQYFCARTKERIFAGEKRIGDVTGQGKEKSFSLALDREAEDQLPVSNSDCENTYVPTGVIQVDQGGYSSLFLRAVWASVVLPNFFSPDVQPGQQSIHTIQAFVARCKTPRLDRTLELRLHGSVQFSSVPLSAEQTSFSIVVCPWESCHVVPKAVASSAPPRKPRPDSPGQGLNPSASDCPAKAACCREKPPGPFSCVHPGPSCPCL